ncbi:ejaculatory bulb-specific protein 3-like [Aricia agestis]|uniref:ejaculatory bulb-specific protein 3-like n=1 Tax=Aricia agestis TaxID=91739 RepID=UPI001C208401|nr:ejaculatory bulb-specific protein 3-like [Aricia agestis]
MKNLLALVVVVAYLATCEGGYAYGDINENFKFEDLEKNPAALKKQVDCYLDRAPCDDIPQHYKTHIREEIVNSCAECDVRLKHNIKTFLHILKKTLPEEYKSFRAKYDPDGTLFDRIENIVTPF